jgi:hypothetical protein
MEAIAGDSRELASITTLPSAWLWLAFKIPRNILYRIKALIQYDILEFFHRMYAYTYMQARCAVGKSLAQ